MYPKYIESKRPTLRADGLPIRPLFFDTLVFLQIDLV